MRVFAGTLTGDSQLVNSRTHGKERVGQLLMLQGKDHTPTDELGAGHDRRGAEAEGDQHRRRAGRRRQAGRRGADRAARAGGGVRDRGPHKGDEDKVHASLRRLQEEDPSLDVHRDEETGETIVGGLSQMHVETVLERMHRRFGVEVDLKPPRVPYRETIRKPARAHGRHKKQTGGRGQFGDCHIEIEPIEGHEGYEFIDKIVGGVIPQGFRPAVDKGIQEAMQQGRAGGRSRGRASGCGWSTAPTTTSTRPRWRSRSPARWPSSRPWRQPTRCCWSRSCGSTSPSPRRTWAT